VFPVLTEDEYGLSFMAAMSVFRVAISADKSLIILVRSVMACSPMIGWAEVDAVEEDADGGEEGGGASAVERLVGRERGGQDHP
jgi:hypothetical protein